jgi:Protein of unknown function (DUF3738)
MRCVAFAFAVTVMAAVAQTPAGQKPAVASTTAAPARFETVSIRQSIPERDLPLGARGGPGGCKGSAPQADPGRIVLNNNSVYTLIAWAYGLECHKAKAYGLISGGPSWVGTDQWVIQAIIPEASGLQLSTGVVLPYPGRSPISDPKLQRMLQNLLADRFKLALHRENKEIPVYELTVAKGGPKLQHPEDVPSADPNVGGPGAAPSAPSGPSIFTALQEQLGLKLESARAPFEALAIDSVSRPSEN